MERQAADGTFYQQVGKDEWTPVTREAQDGTVYKKVGADDWSPLEQPKAAAAPARENSSGDAEVIATRGVLMGARPFVAGVGGGIGKAIGRAERADGSGILERIKQLPASFGEGFSEARRDAQEEEADVQARRPGWTMAGDIGGAVLTAPLFALKGAQLAANAGKGARLLHGTRQGAQIGAAMGGLQALGHAENAGEAIETVGAGMLTGGAAQGAINAVKMAAPAIGGAIKAGSKKVASALTGVSEKEISTYASRADEVKKLIQSSGGDISAAADDVRRTMTRDIQVTRQKLGNQIGQALDDPKYAGTAVDGAPILKALDDQIASVGKTTARFRPDEINELKNVRDLVAGSLDQKGQVGLRTLSEIKEELQIIAKPSYNNGALIFPKGDLAARGAKGAAGEARRLLNAAAPEIQQANNQLSRLHKIEEVMNKNLIREGKPEAALLAAGSGSNPRNARILSGLDQITGGNAVRGAENLAAARSFNNTQLLPVDTTGKAVGRMLAGGGVGSILGGPIGTAIGTAATSPAALKRGLDVARFASRIARATGRGISGALPQTPAGTGRAAAAGLTSQNASARYSESGPITRRLRFLQEAQKAKKPGQK